ncbi:Caspase domain-containing protein [Collimonas sp. OK607]|uniref:caspase family protein n=1 Tax=Collimonas sp. OK607 TaxID=1798194 RepID=UPI0008EAF81F|nr:caspase family protein [Collimonas sp. OK607]SFB21451.1 Caspase domain-containing protein [Collimonas sp. OK607]
MSKTFQSGRALVIGVGEYESLSPLGSAPVYDAEDIANFLASAKHCGYLAENVHILRNADASRTAIVNGLKKLAADAGAGDTVVVYFSGHGAQQLSGPNGGTYLCPSEFDIYRPRETGIEAEELSELLNQIPAERLLVLVDACHSGAVARIKGAAEDVTKWAFGGPRLDALAQGKGRVIISASASDESSVILSLHRNSLFTHFLLKGLQGDVDDRSDGLIRVLDLFHYLAELVPATHSSQNPVLTTRTQDNFPVALRKGGQLKSAEEPIVIPSTASSASPRELEDLLVTLYPQGPLDQEIWSRAGGDVASLRISSTGRAAWHAALRLLAQGGGGASMSMHSLLTEASSEFGANPDLKRLLGNA